MFQSHGRPSFWLGSEDMKCYEMLEEFKKKKPKRKVPSFRTV
jgi:hypothetical protein